MMAAQFVTPFRKRQLSAMLAHDEIYAADAWLKHPMLQRPAGKHALSVAAMA